MTYYEELGIPPNAAEEEIRRAHRLLTRLLHPDQHTDEALQRAAGLQFRRINLMMECLLDPAERKRYDESLREPVEPLVEARWPAPLQGLFSQKFWRIATVALMAVFAIAALTWRPQAEAWPTLPAAPAQAVSQALALESGDTVDRNVRRRAQLRTADPVEVVKPEIQPVRTQALAGGSAESKRRVAVFADAEEWTEPAAPVPAGNPGRGVETPTVPRLAPAPKEPIVAGTWIYSPKPGTTDGKMYRPEYIELKLHSEDGMLFGQYKGRYVIPDRPISPTVAFQFAGKMMTGSNATFPWKGVVAGSAGQVELKLLSERTLQVDWKATEVHDSLGLVSGTAVLIRRN